MNYKKEFNRLLDFAEQALSGGIDFKKRTILGFTGLYVLSEFISHYRDNEERYVMKNKHPKLKNKETWMKKQRKIHFDDYSPYCNVCGSCGEPDCCDPVSHLFKHFRDLKEKCLYEKEQKRIIRFYYDIGKYFEDMAYETENKDFIKYIEAKQEEIFR